jgi:catechol 2,3-dioxygenase-like lactoylglutathione lyase family enzyme
MPVKGLIHYALEVPDPVVGQEFYRDFGLKEADSRGNSLKLQTSRGAGELILFEGPKKRLHHIALAAPGDDFEQVELP